MDDSRTDPSSARAVDLLDAGDHEAVAACLERIETEAASSRKRTLRALRSLAEDRPAAFAGVVPALTPFLTDGERSIRLTTAKLLVAVAEADPSAVVPALSALADRLADDEEFYYVRARSAEALGYVALEHPDVASSPEVLADLRIGLSFDEPEVREKLAKALEHVALGDPRRLRHHVSTLVAHLDDDVELVRYHLCTALAVVGCASPDSLVDGRTALVARLDDDSPFVRGRAAEALGLLARVDASVREALDVLDDEEPFVAERTRFALGVDASRDERAGDPGTVDGIRATTGDAVAAITTPNADGECRHCGLALPENGPPMCPRCGAPH